VSESSPSESSASPHAEPFTDGIRPRWYPRVKPDLIRRLYENDAQGLVDEELVEEVGFALFLRCQSILIATKAHDGHATCPRCQGLIEHHWDKEAPMICPACGWQTTWGAYFKTYQNKQLHGGGAVFAFEAYVEQYPRARTPREKVLLIDRLLHVFHHELTNMCTRPAACNLIEGKIAEVTAFLDQLTYGAGTAPELAQQYAAWQEKAQVTDWIRGILSASRAQRLGDGCVDIHHDDAPL
jgi:hypothetical protein